MKILGIETSSNICSVAIVEDEKVIKELHINDEKTHSIKLMPLIEELLSSTKLELKDIDALACSIGPGSYTGIRIGVATTMAMRDVFNTTTYGIPSLLGLAYNIEDFSGIICPLIDSRNNNVYCGIFDSNKCLLQPYLADNIDIIIDAIKGYSEPILFLGDGAILYKEKLQSIFPAALFAEGDLNNSSSASIALACFNKENCKEYDKLTPMYLRPSQAERQMKNS